MKSLGFDFKHLKGDLFGGVNAGIVALPSALAFGPMAGLEPIHGLYGAIILGLLAALVGGTNTLISNPTGPMAYVTGVTVAALIVLMNKQGYDVSAGNVSSFLPVLLLIFFLAGAFQILFGILKLGKYVHYIPEPVISGFMSGIGGIIIISQINKFLGSGVKAKGAFNTIMMIPESISQADLVSVIFAASTIFIIYFFPKITKAVPATLVAIVFVTLVAALIGVDNAYIIGEIPRELPNAKIATSFSSFGTYFYTDNGINWPMVTLVVGSAIYLASIGVIDALLTAVVADKLTKTKHKSDRELIGQGIGNMASSVFGGMPGAGTTAPTVLNIRSGGRTRLSGIIHALVLVIILAVAAPVAALIPKAALAGVLITIGISILDKRALRRYKHLPKSDNMVMLAVLILTIFWDLLPAVGVGLVWAALIFMKEMANVVEGETRDSKIDRLVDQIIENFDNADEFRKVVVVKNLKGPMFFGFASRFQDSIDEIPTGVKAVLLNFGGVNYLDQSGLYTFEEVVERLNDRGINVCLSEVKESDLGIMKKIGIVPNMIDEEHVFSSVEESIMWLNEPGHIDNIFVDDKELYIPSAYTPNGDGINDEWELKNINRYPQCMVKIFTREKEEIFASKGYKVMWEGFDENGKNLPSDTYLYEIDLYGNGREVRKGKVTIFR